METFIVLSAVNYLRKKFREILNPGDEKTILVHYANAESDAAKKATGDTPCMFVTLNERKNMAAEACSYLFGTSLDGLLKLKPDEFTGDQLKYYEKLTRKQTSRFQKASAGGIHFSMKQIGDCLLYTSPSPRDS